MSQSSNDITEGALSPDLDSHLDNLIGCISDDECGGECGDIITSAHYFTSGELLIKNDIMQPSSNKSRGSRSSFEQNRNLQPPQSTPESIELGRQSESENVYLQGDEKLVVTNTELLLDPKNVKTSIFPKMPTYFSTQVTNEVSNESNYKALARATDVPEIKKTFKRRNSSGIENNVKPGSPFSSWPGQSSKFREYQSDSNLTNAKNLYNSDFACLNYEDKSCREQTEELVLGNTESSHHTKMFAQEIFSESLSGTNCNTLTSKVQVSQDVNQHDDSVFKAHVTLQYLSEEPVLAQEEFENIVYNTTNESLVSLKMSPIYLNAPAPSQPDLHPLYFTDKSLSENSSVSSKQFLVQQLLSVTSALVPKELPNQAISSATSASPLRVNDSPMASAHSPDISREGSSLNEGPRSVELFSSSTSVESSSSDSSNIIHHKGLSSHTDNQSVLSAPENSLQNPVTRELPDAPSKELNCNSIINMLDTNLDQSTRADVVLSLPAVSAITALQFELQEKSEPLRQDVAFSVLPAVDITEKITNKLPSTFTAESPAKTVEIDSKYTSETSAKNISLENVTKLNNLLELCHNQDVKHAMSSVCQYEYQELPRSPLMLMSVDGVTHAVLNDDHIVPHCEVKDSKEECIVPELETSTTITDYDHNYCDEMDQRLLSETETLHSVDTNSGAVQNHKVNQQNGDCNQDNSKVNQQGYEISPENYEPSQQNYEIVKENYETNEQSYKVNQQNCEAKQQDYESNQQNYKKSHSQSKLISTCAHHHQDSTRASLPISTEINDNKFSLAMPSNEETENTSQQCLDKLAFSHLSNETSILSFKDTIINEEHRVPDAEQCENVCLNEISLYNELPENKQDDSICKQTSKQAFQWNTVYETQMNKSLTDQTVGDSVFEGLSSIQPICQSHRPRRVGLSKKQKVMHLHNKL